MSLTSPPPPSQTEPLSQDDLRQIATRQKGVLICILIYLLTVLATIVVGESLLVPARIVFIAVAIGATAFALLLAVKLYSTATGIVLGLLTLIPLIGLIVLLVINGKATGILKENGISVGLLGAKGPVV